jgi:hypothetical protein
MGHRIAALAQRTSVLAQQPVTYIKGKQSNVSGNPSRKTYRTEAPNSNGYKS